MIIYKDDGLTLTEGTAHFNGMCWPRVSTYLDELDWRLRYSGEPTRSDVLMAASFLGAYQSLVMLTRREREYIVRRLREAEDIADSCATVKAGSEEG